MRITVGHTFISGRISCGEITAADECTSSVERGADDELVVVEITFTVWLMLLIRYHSYFNSTYHLPL